MSVEQLKGQSAQLRAIADLMDAAIVGVTDTPKPPVGNVLSVIAGGNLQHAIDIAKPGDTIHVQPGAYQPIILRKPATTGAPILIRPDVDDASLPGPTTRARADRTEAYFSITSPSVSIPAVRTDPGAAGWTLLGLHALSPGIDHTLVALGSGSDTTLAELPSDITLDRCVLDGQWACRRGVALNSGRAAIVNSVITGIMKAGQDTQCIGGTNGSGPFTIENNLLCGGTETVMFGGGDPRIPNLVPSDIVIRGNTLTKDWDMMHAVRGTVKNALELKNAQRVLIEHNVIEYAWTDGQVGWLIVLSVRNQDGTAPWSTLKDITIRHNVLRHGNNGISILAMDDSVGLTSVRAANIDIHDNLVYDIGGSKYGGDTTAAFMINEAITNGSIRHNTVIGATSKALHVNTGRSGQQAQGFLFTDNILPEGAYGITSEGNAPLGAGGWQYYADAASRCDGNAFVTRTPRPRTIPYPGTQNVVGPVTFDAACVPQWLGVPPVTTDGKPAGADLDEIKRRIPDLVL